MMVRNYQPEDCVSLSELFFHTVHAVNAKDYTKVQLDAWATGRVDLAAWNDSFLKHMTLVAEEGGAIVGFGDMDDIGYLDRLYVHKDHQRNGIASAIVTALEQKAAMKNVNCFSVFASITAKPFFEQRGYLTVRENKVVRSSVELINFLMIKNAKKHI